MGSHLEEKTLEYLQIYKIDIQVTFKTACFALKKSEKRLIGSTTFDKLRER